MTEAFLSLPITAGSGMRTPRSRGDMTEAFLSLPITAGSGMRTPRSRGDMTGAFLSGGGSDPLSPWADR
jgi:hypothetical protein